MKSITSAGLLLYRHGADGLEVFLAHPGGPFWRAKDEGAWSIPKGLTEHDEEPLTAALREFTEETGFTAAGPFTPLGTVKIRSGKMLTAFAAEGDCVPADLVSNTFALEWPPRSGRTQDFPEIDRGAWFTLDEARVKIAPGQRPLIEAFYKMVQPQKPAPAQWGGNISETDSFQDGMAISANTGR